MNRGQLSMVREEAADIVSKGQNKPDENALDVDVIPADVDSVEFLLALKPDDVMGDDRLEDVDASKLLTFYGERLKEKLAFVNTHPSVFARQDFVDFMSDREIAMPPGGSYFKRKLFEHLHPSERGFDPKLDSITHGDDGTITETRQFSPIPGAKPIICDDGTGWALAYYRNIEMPSYPMDKPKYSVGLCFRKINSPIPAR